MKYLDALSQLDAMAEYFSVKFEQENPEWRLHVRPRGESHTTQVELQHWETGRDGGGWLSVANVSCEVKFGKSKLLLTTYINCTMCGRWSNEKPRAAGLNRLFAIADIFEDFTAGKEFEA